MTSNDKALWVKPRYSQQTEFLRQEKQDEGDRQERRQPRMIAHRAFAVVTHRSRILLKTDLFNRSVCAAPALCESIEPY